MIGKVKTLTDKGYGFISREKGEKDLFFHVRDFYGASFEDLKVGDEVEFEIGEGDRGPFAANVSLAPESTGE